MEFIGRCEFFDTVNVLCQYVACTNKAYLPWPIVREKWQFANNACRIYNRKMSRSCEGLFSFFFFFLEKVRKRERFILDKKIHMRLHIEIRK